MRVQRFFAALFVPLMPALAVGAQPADTVRICLAPAAVEASNNSSAAADAVRATFASFLTGPTLTSQPLQARLISQAREEARLANCPFTLFTTINVVSKRSGGGVLGKIAAGAARQGVAETGITRGSTAGRIVGSAATQATTDYATTIRSRDEITLGWRLEAADGKVLVEKKEKRAAKSDGEDLLTPLVQPAAEQIVEAARKKNP
jgi:hypothetical protein